MIDKFIRLIRIITLIQAHPGIMARELAERLEVTDRTLYRDMAVLSSAHIPIVNNGHGKGYEYLGNFAIYPPDFSDEEALAFSMLPSVLEQFESQLPPHFYSAFEKVLASHEKEQSRKREFAENISDVIQMGSPAYRESSGQFVAPIIQAIVGQRTIRAAYHTQSRNENTIRDIDPYYLVPREHRFYLIGYCHSAEDIRTFRVSRFQQVELLHQTFDKSGFNIKTYMKNTWSIERGDRQIKFKIRFSPEAARYVREEELFVKPRLSEESDGSLLFEATVNSDREFLNWLSQYGPEAEILSPASYRKAMKERLADWIKLYS